MSHNRSSLLRYCLILLLPFFVLACEPPPPNRLPSKQAFAKVKAVKKSVVATSSTFITPEMTLRKNEVLGVRGCSMCHAKQGLHIQASIHKDLDGSPLGLPVYVKGCEVCHGGGRRHMLAPRKHVQREGAIRLCTACHDGSIAKLILKEDARALAKGWHSGAPH